MQLILDKKNTSKKRKKSPLQARFDRLSEQLARKRRQHDRFIKDIDELAEISQRLNTEHDRKQLPTLIALAKKLTTFSGRKSLSNWHRDELLDWLRELILTRIAPLEPKTAEQLQVKYEETMAALAGMTHEEAMEAVRAQQEEAERQAQQPHEAETAREEEPDDELEEDSFQGDLFGFDDIPPQPEPEQTEAQTDQNNPFADAWPPEETGPNITDSDWLKGLFRRAAQALHPDREADPKQRHHKQQQMKALLRARKHNDVMSMLSIYSEAIGEHDIRVADGELQTICELLEQQIEQLELEQMEHVESHPERSFAHAVLYHSSKKRRAQLLKEWRSQLDVEAAQNSRLVGELRNLTILKEVLGERYDQRRGMLNNIFDEIMDIL